MTSLCWQSSLSQLPPAAAREEAREGRVSEEPAVEGLGPRGPARWPGLQSQGLGI